MSDERYSKEHKAIVYPSPDTRGPQPYTLQDLDIANSKWTTRQILSAVVIVFPLISSGYLAWNSLEKDIAELKLNQKVIVKVDSKLERLEDKLIVVEKELLVGSAKIESRLDALERAKK